ncbi:RNA methyltransferase [Aggregatimonas sangjinii]|uniref:RNA methyltransferase n=1 Tax=Aggregatimonas sangjinii TaxID=2583587 RepID=A0A5B7SKT0_9FLAO|nr:RNA methyltransferase [Aggregatimonas sangjinii]QCW99086.1 RNA methyltransferase [Aggregatimonas sangjinii]
MVVKNQIKFIKSLQQKKYRNQNGMFVVEGIKSVREFLNSDYKVEKVYVTKPDIFNMDAPEMELVSAGELAQMSGLHSPNSVLGVFHIPIPKKLDVNDWILVLDDVRDPGNLGTIIRLCDWFGIEHLVCSEHTVDCYNPKVLQATMGSITRVNLGYTDLTRFLSTIDLPIFGTFMNGASVYTKKIPTAGILIMGNEANGISATVEKLVNHKISIPQPASRAGMHENQNTESLNVATATAIFLNEIRRE